MADTKVTLRPDADFTNFHRSGFGGAWSDTGNANVNDNSDATYARFNDTVSDDGDFGFIWWKIGDVSPPALSRITKVQIRARSKCITDWMQNEEVQLFLTDERDGTPTEANWTYYDRTYGLRWSQSNIIQELVSAMFTDGGIKGAWTATLLNNTAVGISVGNLYYKHDSYWYEVYLDVYYNQVPVVDVTAPTGTVSNTSQPTVTWSYTDPEGDSQLWYRVKVFTDAQYGAGGFDPETSAATWDSGETSGTVNSKQVGIPLSDDTYRAYVKVSDTSDKRWSLWDYSQWIQNTTPPNAPTISLTPDATNNRMRVNLTASGAGPTTDYFMLERSDDGGGTYSYVRGGSNVTNTGGTVYYYDYENPPNTDVYYRARAVYLSGGFPLVSSYTAAVHNTVAVTSWWLKDPLDATKNRIVHLNGEGFTARREKAGGRFYAFGRRNVIGVRTMARGAEFTLSLMTEGETEFAAIVAMFESTSHPTLLLQNDMKSQWYLDFADMNEELPFFTERITNPVRILTFDVAETDAP